jgi:hypothetical protein
LDDVNTLRDPNSSGLAKGLATAGFLPIGKAIKGGKLILKLKDKTGKVIEKEFKLVDEALDYAKACNCFTAGTKIDHFWQLENKSGGIEKDARTVPKHLLDPLERLT